MSAEKYSKLIKILMTFSEEEFKDFEKTATSPFLGYGRNYNPYIKILKKGFPGFEGEMFFKENIRKYVHNKVHPENEYNDQYMKNIFSDLVQIAEESMYQKVSKKYNHHNLIFLAMEETKRELFHLANHNINLVSDRLNESGFDELYFFYKGMNEIAGSVLENKMHGLNHETGKPVSSGESFIYFSLILLTLSIYNSEARKAMLNLNGDKNFSEKFVELIDLDGLETLLLQAGNPDSGIILIYFYYLLHHYSKPGYANFKKMRDLVAEQHSRFNNRMLFLITSMLSSVLYDLRNKLNPEEFGKEYHKLVNFSLKNKCYKALESSSFQFIKFRSYYLNALAIGEVEWVENFAADYGGELAQGNREEALCLLRANVFFEKGNYDDSLAELGKVKYSMLLSKFDMRVLKMKIYFEKGLYLNAENSADTFNKFISNNKKLAKVFLENFILFSKYYRALIDIAHDKVKEPMFILDEVKNSHVFPERRWLIGKIDKFARLKSNIKQLGKYLTRRS